MGIQENVAIGKEVTALLALTDDWDDAHFIRLRDQLLVMHPLPVPQKQQLMGGDDLKRYERNSMPFGKFMGWHIGDVPLEYLDWLCRSQEDFYCDLRRYLLARNKEDRDDDEIDS